MSPARPASASVTIDLGNGDTYHVQLRHPVVEIEHRSGPGPDIASFGAASPVLRSYRGPSTMRVVLEGFPDDPHRMVVRKAAPPAPRRPTPSAPPPAAEPGPGDVAPETVVDGVTWIGLPPPMVPSGDAPAGAP